MEASGSGLGATLEPKSLECARISMHLKELLIHTVLTPTPDITHHLVESSVEGRAGVDVGLGDLGRAERLVQALKPFPSRSVSITNREFLRTQNQQLELIELLMK